MRYREIVLEYDRSATLKNFGEKLAQRYQRDRDTTFKKDDPALAEKLAEYLESIDHTKKQIFVKHLCRWYADGSMRHIEDAPKAIEPINLFVKFKNRLNGVNVNAMSFDDFLNLGDELKDTKSGKEQDKEEEQMFFDTGDAELFYNDAELKITIPKTEEASAYFGRNTRWCTAAKNNSMFSSYNSEGPLYIILFKKTNVRWQFHFETCSFMDEKDHAIDPDLVRGNLKLQDLFKKNFLAAWKDLQGGNTISDYDEEPLVAYLNGDFFSLEQALDMSQGSMSILDTRHEALRHATDDQLVEIMEHYPWAFASFPPEVAARISGEDMVEHWFDTVDRSSVVVQRAFCMNYLQNIKDQNEEVHKAMLDSFPGLFYMISEPSEEVEEEAAISLCRSIRVLDVAPDLLPDEIKKSLAHFKDSFAISLIQRECPEVEKVLTNHKVS